jgi:uncharacterized paraquat-inducible protein A
MGGAVPGLILILVLLLFVLWLAALVRAGLSARRGFRQYRGVLRQDRGLCAACGYDLTGNTSGVCPECGTPTRAAW